MLDEQGHAAGHAIVVAQGVEVARTCRLRLKLGQHARVARVGLRPHLAQTPVGGVQTWGQGGGAGRLVVVKRIAEHHRAGLQGLRKHVVKSQLGPQLRELRAKLGDVFEFVLCELFEHIQARRGVFFGQHHVQRHQGHAVFLEQVAHQLRQAVAPPRPAAFAALVFFAQALFVNIDHHNAVVLRVGRQSAHPGVVQQRLYAGQQGQLPELGNMAGEQGHQQRPDQNPQPMFAHRGSA